MQVVGIVSTLRVRCGVAWVSAILSGPVHVRTCRVGLRYSIIRPLNISAAQLLNRTRRSRPGRSRVTARKVTPGYQAIRTLQTNTWVTNTTTLTVQVFFAANPSENRENGR